jgi:hypothetical protein
MGHLIAHYDSCMNKIAERQSLCFIAFKPKKEKPITFESYRL